MIFGNDACENYVIVDLGAIRCLSKVGKQQTRDRAQSKVMMMSCTGFPASTAKGDLANLIREGKAEGCVSWGFEKALPRADSQVSFA